MNTDNYKGEALISKNSTGIKGNIETAADKSISHRSLIIGAMSLGVTRVENILEGEDVLRTEAALHLLGVKTERFPGKILEIHGVGVGGLKEPEDILDMGNAGTGARLMMGLVSSYPFTSIFTGDTSLRKRPMKRVIDPLSLSGSTFLARNNSKLPLAVCGNTNLLPISYEMPIASAQVKSAIILAGLNIPGETTVIEKSISRDHTEKMLQGFGADISYQDTGQGRKITVKGLPELKAQTVRVPGDFSSAVFLIAAALICEGSEITVSNVGINQTRTGLYRTLVKMGANINQENIRSEGGEPVADIKVSFSPDMKGIEVAPEEVPTMIDEFPILSVISAYSKGKTIMKGISELRLKESDRIAAMANGLKLCGVEVEEGDDFMVVHGCEDRKVKGGSTISASLDHRIAMSFVCLGLASEKPVEILGAETIRTSYPDFVDTISKIGGNLEKQS